MSIKILLVGAGLANAALLHFLRLENRIADANYVIIDKRNHVGGNCYTSLQSASKTMIHNYGPHIFNTNHRKAWDFMNSYLTMHPYTNRVKASTKSGMYSFPINLHTINQYFGEKLLPNEADQFMAKLRAPYTEHEPRNFEEAMLSFVGRELYQEFIYGYTVKQWGIEPRELPASIAKRLPFRLNYDDSYYDKEYQGLPVEGYTHLFNQVFSGVDVEINLSTPYESSMKSEFNAIFYTGSIDDFFKYQLGYLSYRTVYWEEHMHQGPYQGNAVINHTDSSIPYTRINEPHYFEPWKRVPPSLSPYFVEYSKATTQTDIPYYPMRLRRDKQLIRKYQNLAAIEEKIFFHGRLGTYRYLDMDRVIMDSFQLASDFASSI